MDDASIGPSSPDRRWALGGEAFAVLILVPALWFSAWAFGAAGGNTGYGVWAAVGLVACAVICLGSLARTDPVGYASIAGPVLVSGAIVVALEWARMNAAALVTLAFAWLVAWIFFGDRIWPTWSRLVLRRGATPEATFADAYQRLRTHWEHDRATDRGALWEEVQALEVWRTPRTAPIINGLLASLDIGVRESDQVRAPRVRDRLDDEWARFRRDGTTSSKGAAITERPTRGTLLEYLIPELEALVAEVKPDRQRRIAVESARYAYRLAGATDLTIEAALDDAARGRPDVAERDRIGRELAALPRPSGDMAGPAAEAALIAAWRRAVSLSAVLAALVEPMTPVAAADAVYEGSRSLNDAELAELTRLVTGLAGPEAAERAVIIEPDPTLAPTSGRRADDGRPAGPARTDVSVAGLAAVGLAAGIAGSAIREPLWAVYGQVPQAAALDNLVGVVIVALVAVGLLLIGGYRLSPMGILGLYIGSLIASVLVAMLSDPTEAFTFVLLYGVAYALVLVTGAVLLRRGSTRNASGGAPTEA